MATETINSTQAPWAPLQPHLQRGFDRAENLYNTGGPRYFPDQTYASHGNITNEALNAHIDQARAGNPITDPAQGMIADTLNGNYLQPDSNPYLQGMYDDAAGAVTRNYQEAVAPGIQSQFANSGRMGSGLYANAMDSSRDTLSRNLGGMAQNLYGQNFSNERNRMMQAAQMAPQTAGMSYLDMGQLLNVGQAKDAKQQQHIDDRVNRFRHDQERPWDVAARTQGLLGGNYGQSNSQEQNVPSGLQQGLGLGLSGLGLLGEAFGKDGIFNKYNPFD